MREVTTSSTGRSSSAATRLTRAARLWGAGISTTRAGGAWGLLEVVPDLNAKDLGAGRGKRPCAR